MRLEQPSPRRGIVVTYSSGASGGRNGHESSTRREIARRLAAMMGFAYAGEYDPLAGYAMRPYFVPRDTLIREVATRVGIRGEGDLFGAVVPHPFAGTKTITHRLVADRSRAPAGWSDEFGRRVAHVVLDGFSAFSYGDALRAGRRCLERGPVRVKPGAGIGGLGQCIVDSEAELARALDGIEWEALTRFGVVIEENLNDVTTYSIGQVRVAGMVGSYHGLQHLTTNNRGLEVYGGSGITMVRGGFAELLALPMSDALRVAIVQARTYDRAAGECFDGFFASRRNYDVAQGRDAAGRHRSGVLEQSWRVGGASGAEIAALEAFRADPSLRRVRAVTREVYGEAPAVPGDATVYFAGSDPDAGPLIKYARRRSHADAR